MAFIYEKKDPRDTSRKRWMAKIKIGSEWQVVSLRMRAPENKRAAQARATKLQVECDAGLLSDETREWLGSSVMRIEIAIGKASAKVFDGAPDCWESATKGWLKYTEAQDSVTEIPGKVNPIARTRITREYTMRCLNAWLKNIKEPFIRRSYTAITKDYLQARAASTNRKGKPLSPDTVWTDYSYLMTFGDWLAERNLCEKPNRKDVKSIMPPKPAREVILPEWEDDLSILRFFRDMSRKNIGLYGAERTNEFLLRQPGELRDVIVYNAMRDDFACYVIWCLIVIVRGLGCRPSEAISLTWDTVNLKSNVVKFLATKDGKRRRLPSRTVPILFTWVKDALEEMQARWGGRGKPVCFNSLGSFWAKESTSGGALRDRITQYGLPKYRFKLAQKLHIRQLLQMGFPPHAVASWTGHTLTVQERHYCEQTAYLPTDDSIDYAEFGKLTDWGLRVREHNIRFLSTPGLGNNAE